MHSQGPKRLWQAIPPSALSGGALALLALLAAMPALVGCSGAPLGGTVSGLTGGSLPTGDPDILGFVMAVTDVSSQAAPASRSVAGTFRSGSLPPPPVFLLPPVWSGPPPPTEAWPPVGQPLADVDVALAQGEVTIAQTQTDHTGSFAFRGVPAGDLRANVLPPPGGGFQALRESFQHQQGRQTRLVVYLEPGSDGEVRLEAATAASGSPPTSRQSRRPANPPGPD